MNESINTPRITPDTIENFLIRSTKATEFLIDYLPQVQTPEAFQELVKMQMQAAEALRLMMQLFEENRFLRVSLGKLSTLERRSSVINDNGELMCPKDDAGIFLLHMDVKEISDSIRREGV